MAHLNGPALKTWKKGDGLGATDLNGNFAVLADRIERVMAQALMPDQANVALEMRLRTLAERIAALEHLTAMHARQRNEREWAPLSHVGALVTMVNQALGKFDAAVARLDELHAGLLVDHDDLHRRLARLEQQPDAATEEEFVVLANDHERLRLKENMLLAQVIALRHEIRILRELTLGHDRQANRMEFAPLSTVGHLLQRIMALEAAIKEQTTVLAVEAK